MFTGVVQPGSRKGETRQHKQTRGLVLAELALGALRAEHRQLVVDVEVGPPLVGRVLVVPRTRRPHSAQRSSARCLPARHARRTYPAAVSGDGLAIHPQPARVTGGSE